MTRNLGQLGEATLSAWCAQTGITSNPVDQDRTGWDNYVEFPYSEASQTALDKLPAPISARIQVKSTDGTPGVLAIKLSNWVRLVRCSDPAFFLVCEFGGKEICQNAYLVHVGETWIRKILKRLRALSETDDFADLHRRTMSVRYGPEDRLASPSGESLRKAVLAAVGSNAEAYRRKKMQLLQEVGYEDASMEIQFSAVIPDSHKESDPEELLVDFDIGLLASVEIAGGSAWDSRFGIREPHPQIQFPKGGQLSRTREPNLTGQLALFSHATGREVEVPCRVFAPSGVAHLVKKRNLKLRVEVSGGYFVLAPNGTRAQFNLTVEDPESPQALSEIACTARLLSFLHQVSTASGDVVELSIDGDRVAKVTNLDVNVPPAILEWCRVVETIQAILSELGKPPHVQVVVAYPWQNLQNLDLAKRLLIGLVSDIEITGELTTGAQSDEPECCFPVIVDLPFGPFRVFLTGALLGPYELKVESDKTNLVFRPTRFEAHTRRTLLPDEPLPEPPLHLLRRIGEAHEEERLVVYGYDLDRHAR